ncbi:hypothetical protein Tco_0338627, partial [Tanacetum coccineum]
IEISSDRDFLRPAPSYVHIRDPVRRLCHRMIACSISGRGQGAEKVIGVDLFYLWTMDYETANVPYLLAQYLFRFVQGRKSGVRLSGGHFIGLNICLRYGDTWAWVALGPKRQQAAAAGAPAATKGACIADEGA